MINRGNEDVVLIPPYSPQNMQLLYEFKLTPQKVFNIDIFWEL